MSVIGIPYTINEIAQAIIPKDLYQGNLKQEALHFLSFDSRHIQYGDQTLFVAIRTKNRDGHDFIRNAYEKGVRNFIVDKIPNLQDINYILVENTLESLQVWAHSHRKKFTYPVIAITGSNGKTTVKEWLTTLLEGAFQVVKSPMSYNSQIGVPVSLLQMNFQAQVAIIEAGISLVGEMEILREMIQPTLGILTHMGTAHADGFSSMEEKIKEKLSLFTNVSQWIYSGEQEIVNQVISGLSLPPSVTFEEYVRAYGKINLAGLHVSQLLETAADRENASLCILMAKILGMDISQIQDRLSLLYPVHMRTEMITDNPEITLINDSYNSDFDSVMNAIEILKKSIVHKNKKLILTDMLHQGSQHTQQHIQVLTLAEKIFGEENVYTIGETFFRLRTPENESPKRSFLKTDDFIHDFRYEEFRNSTVLLKGARQFGLERIVPFMNHKLNASVFKINLNSLIHNLRFFRGLIPKNTKMMCMVKAFSYGSGTWEIAEVLEKEGVDYLAVAYASEGIELREKGIRLPIMVMNPDGESMDALVRFNIEPEIYDFSLLDRYIRAARLAGLSRFPIHLKFDTGMGRLGFLKKDLEKILTYLTQYPDLQVVSLMTHLAAADDMEAKNFTLRQIELFTQICDSFSTQTGIFPLRHVLNSSGILHYPEYAMDMVRLGIGLYGINPVSTPFDLKEIGSLLTTISQIHEYPAGTSVGYGRSQYTERFSRIATVPIGYADGIFRSLSNGKLILFVHDKPAPVFGRICMDMMMIDITDIPEAKDGDEVLLFGQSGNTFRSVSEVGRAAGTIPYEILTRISPRVRRVYVWE